MSNRRGFICGVLAVFFWSTVASAFKFSLRYIDYIQLLFYSSLTSIFTLFLIIIIQRKLYQLYSALSKNLMYSILLGFLNPFLYYTVLFKAYSILPAQEALALNYVWPIVLVIFSIIFLKERVKAYSLISLLIGFIGVLIISSRGNILSFRFTRIDGVILALGSSIIWASYWILNIRDNLNPVIRLFLNFAFGLFFSFLTVILFSNIFNINLIGILGCIYVGLFEMSITFTLWLTALRSSKSTARIANLIYFAPFLSLLIIHLVIGEKIFPSTFIGLILIISATIIQNMLK